MKKKIIGSLIALVLLTGAVLFFPFKTESYDDGGTRTFRTLICQVVKWNKHYNGDLCYNLLRVYFYPDNKLSVDELWEKYHASKTVVVPEEGDGEIEKCGNQPEMVMFDGVLYTSTGETETEVGCGTPDGVITSTVSETEIPAEDNQSNFGTGFKVQRGRTEKEIVVFVNDRMIIFRAEEK